MSLEGAQEAPVPDVPEAHGLVIGSGSEGLAIGAEDYAPHPIRMYLEGAEGAAIADVPEVHGLVIGPRGEGLAIGAEGDALNRSRVTVGRPDRLPRDRIPELERA